MSPAHPHPPRPLPPGVRLCTSPDVLLVQVAPLTRLLEDKAGLQPHGAGDRASLALAGLALFALGYSSLMAVYTLDKKAQMNASASQRLGLDRLCAGEAHSSSPLVQPRSDSSSPLAHTFSASRRHMGPRSLFVPSLLAHAPLRR